MWKMVQSKKIYLCFFVFAFVLLCWEPSPIGAIGAIGVKEGPKHPKHPKHPEQGVTNPDHHKIEFEYKPGSKIGPENWGNLRKEWDTCKIGKSQSPIELRDDLVKKIPKKSGDIIINYKSANATLKNEGHAIMVVWADGAGSITINGTEYFLSQCHWHTPSEHTVNGKRYDAELHMVHKSKNNSVAVVGFLYKIGKPNPFLSQVRKAMLSVAGKATDNNLGVIDPRKMKKAQQEADKKSKNNDKYKNGSSKFYRYMGSFTTPPCTEGVTWTINKKVHTVSSSQVKLLQKAVFDYATMNARPLQPLYGREIKLHGSHFGQ